MMIHNNMLTLYHTRNFIGIQMQFLLFYRKEQMLWRGNLKVFISCFHMKYIMKIGLLKYLCRLYSKAGVQVRRRKIS